MALLTNKNMLKGIFERSKKLTPKEQIHGDFGIDLIKIIRDENPEWFDEEYENRIQTMCIDAYGQKSALIDWIFEKGELDFLPKNQVKEFVKDRFNRSLESIGVKKVFKTDESILNETEWFNDEIIEPNTETFL